jgi:hypothetical protein
MAYREHVLPSQWQRPKIEVPVSAEICTTISQRVHLNVKVLHDQNARIRVRFLDLDDGSDALRCGITSGKYTGIVPNPNLNLNPLILVIVVVIVILIAVPGGFPAMQSCESLTKGETFWWRTISQASFPHTGMVELQIRFTDHIGKKFA